jgi:glucoamylase
MSYNLKQNLTDDSANHHVFRMGVIGNCSYLAYIDIYADVKWLCLPAFDSSFIFGSLLDEKKGGTFSIQPAEAMASSNQYYLKNTNILVTEFSDNGWAFRVTDFAPRFYQYDRYFRPLMLVRKVEPLRGTPFIRVQCEPRGQYGTIIPETVQGSNHIRYLNLESQVRLTTDVPVSYILKMKPFVLTGTQYFVLTYGVPLEASLASTAEAFLEKTRDYWNKWVKTTAIPSLFQEELIRSALVLKLHQYEDTGGIIASGTTSLPEYPGSGRTWDYRYCWMRDTYYTLNAFSNIGHFEELEKYFIFIQNIIFNENSRIKPLYRINGEPVPKEVLADLAGYRGEQPVRIGNNAAFQVQNDVYGQVLVSLYPLFMDKRLNYYDPVKTLNIIRMLIEGIEKTIDEPDSGIWEFHKINQLHTYTLLFHWAGSKAACKMAHWLNDADLEKKARKLIEKTTRLIESCYVVKRKAYMQSQHGTYLDASGLQLIIMNYLDPHSQKARKFLHAIENELKNESGLLYRYIHDDDIGRQESSFLLCSFWYAEALACVGRLDEALNLVSRLTHFSNHLGLFSEDTGPDGSQWGNFPQTYSHVGLINAVYRISARLDNPIFL